MPQAAHSSAAVYRGLSPSLERQAVLHQSHAPMGCVSSVSPLRCRVQRAQDTAAAVISKQYVLVTTTLNPKDGWLYWWVCVLC